MSNLWQEASNCVRELLGNLFWAQKEEDGKKSKDSKTADSKGKAKK